MSPVELSRGTAWVGEVRLSYVTAGEGEPVVLLHGFPQTSFCWRHVIPKLAERHTVVAPDLRGLGDSTKPAGGYDKRTAAGDIRALVRGLGHECVRLVGHDVGGWLAYPYAAAYPDEVERLVLLEAVVPGFGLERQIQEFWHFGFHMAPDIPEALIGGKERMYLDHFFGLATYDRSAITERDLQEYVRCYAAPGGLRAGLGYYRALPQDAEDNRKLAETKLSMPVLALGGEFAQGDQVLDSARQVAEDVRGGTVERCGHWIPEERPHYLADRLLDFLKD
jgi:pimeloyl-ACP methyl ester carboxylesterase